MITSTVEDACVYHLVNPQAQENSMTSLRMHVLVGGAMLLTAGALAAQERPAVASGEQKTNQKQADAGVRPAFGEGGAHAGDYVAVTRKDGQKMTGTLVWIDEKNNRLYL